MKKKTFLVIAVAIAVTGSFASKAVASQRPSSNGQPKCEFQTKNQSPRVLEKTQDKKKSSDLTETPSA